MAGVILAAASRVIPVVIDGFIATTAALIACALEPTANEYLIAAHLQQIGWCSITWV